MGIAWLSAWLCHTSTDIIKSKSDDVMHGDDMPLGALVADSPPSLRCPRPACACIDQAILLERG